MDSTSPCDAPDGSWLALSEEGLRREPHALRSLVPLLADPDCVWLAGGTPHPRCEHAQPVGDTWPGVFASFSVVPCRGAVNTYASHSPLTHATPCPRPAHSRSPAWQ